LTDLLDRLNKDLAGRYAIIGEIATGGMATVYLADDLRHERTVALKVMRPDLAASLGAERFLREIRIAANLSHPHILPLYDSGEAGGSFFYVMPHHRGESLKAKLDREKQMGLEEALRIAGEVADALHYAHEQGVVHRDIKPGNILLDSGHATVADFGLALAVRAAGSSRLTETGVVMGTPSYMSPEHASGDEKLDGRSDIYALGCVLYEMLAGQPPFTGPSSESIMIQHVGADVPQLTMIRPNVPVEVETSVSRALQKAPADRIATAGEFAKSLELAAAHVRVSGPVTSTMANRASAETPGRKLGVTIRPLHAILASAVVVAGIVGISVLSGRSNPASSPTGDAIRMTVIPFENVGSEDRAYFAAGVADEITARLIAVDGLSIIARQSAIEYTASPKTPQEIGDELGVEYYLTSTITWDETGDGPGRVKVVPRLVRTSDGESAWADIYDEDVTDVFDVQRSIAEQVVSALGVALLEPAREALETQPTENLDAFDYYLQGNDYFGRTVSEDNFRNAERVYSRALQLDPQFALAAAKLSMVHSYTYFYYYDRTEQRLEAAREAAEIARTAAPGGPDGHIAMGEYHYRGHLDYDRALEEFETAREMRPDDSQLLVSIGAVERRRGDWRAALTRFKRASDLEPRSASNAVQVGLTHAYLSEFDEARRWFETAISVGPFELRPRVWKARVLISAAGDTAGARAEFEAGDVLTPRELDPQSWWHWAVFRVIDGPSDENLRRLGLLRGEADSWFIHLSTAELHVLRGEAERSRVHYDSARMELEDLVSELPEEPRFRSELGLAYAGLGRTEEAIREGREATRLMPISAEAILGPDWVRNLAQIYTMVGRPSDAVAQLETLLETPSTLTAHWLRLDPIWTPLQSDAGFQALLTGPQD